MSYYDLVFCCLAIGSVVAGVVAYAVLHRWLRSMEKENGDLKSE